ncbi:hypothetical protein C0581_05305 [Candidatus Parcubacteria bacterium]|nr:MAG: hypothetical protein C0581_05305 [Candidatus Parcubacteria bacterium]
MKNKFLFCLILIAISLVLYSPTVTIGFLSDDWGYVYLADRTNITESVSFLWSPDKWGNGLGNYRPMQSIMTVLMWKLNPALIHLFTIVLHGIVSSLVGYLSFVLFQKKSISVISSLVFLFFPLNTEVVVWLASWNTLLATIPLLLALIIYTKKQPEIVREYALVGFFFSLSLLAKEHALVFPFFIIGIDLLKKRRISYKNILVYISIVALYFFARVSVLGKMGGYNGSDMNSRHFEISVQSILLYMKLPLAYVYNFFNSGVVPKGMVIFARVTSFLLVAGVLMKSFYKRKDYLDNFKKLIILGLLIYVGHAIGWNLFVPLDVHNTHARLLYVATVWFAILLGVMYEWVRATPIRYIFFIYIILLPILTIYQYSPWVVAGKKSQKIIDQVKIEASGNPENFVFENLPDQHKGAFVFRNGIEFVVALETNTIKNTISVTKTMQPGIDKSIVIMSE